MIHRSVTVQKLVTLNAQLSNANNISNNNKSNSGSNSGSSGHKLALAQLWSQCASPVSHTSSLAATYIVDLTLKRSLDWNDAFEGFENALATAQGQALSNIVHAISRLCIAAAEAFSVDIANTISLSSPPLSSTSLNISKNVFAIKNNRHPFIALITTKTNVEAILFAEMDKIMDYKSDSTSYRIAALEILSPFLDFVLLDRECRASMVASTAILWISKTLNACLLDHELELFIVKLFDYLCSIPSRFPLDRFQLSTGLQTIISILVDFYSLPSAQLSLSDEYKSVLGSQLLLTILSWTADLRRFGLPTLQLLQTAQKLFKNRKGYHAPTLPFDVIWPLLSFLLMNSPTVDEQTIVVDWMHVVITTTENHQTKAVIASMAFLSIFQVMSESQIEGVIKKCSDILQRLETIPRTTVSDEEVQGHYPPSSSSSTSTPLSQITSGVAAMIQAEVAHLCRIWELGKEQQDEPFQLTLKDDSTLSSLVFTSFMFHPNENVRTLAAAQQAQMGEGRLVTLVLFIYVLRVDPSPLVKLYLLQEAIPSLVTSKDEVVTAKVLRTILTLINGVPNAPTGSKFVHSHMGAVGIRILFLIWKRQPRIWKTLRHVIHGWVESRSRLLKTPFKGEPEYDMEVAVLTTIRDICAYDAAGYAEVLIPFLATLLGSVELYASSICTIIETMNLTVEANVVEPRAAWNVLLCHVAEHAMKTQHVAILQEMCVFYGIVGSRNEDTQVCLDLREAVLVNYIQPLLSSESPKVLASALRALSCFTASEIMPILLPEGPPILYIRERILEVAQNSMVVDEYSLVLDKLVRHELSHMRRSLFKDAAFKKSTPDNVSAGAQELERLQGVMEIVSSSILQKWQSGNVNPGLRIGYALSGLLCSSAVTTADSASTAGDNGVGGVESMETIRTRQSYRNVMTALTDVTLTDHLIERISALEGWTALFDNMWIPSDDTQTLIIAETLILDLYKKIMDGYVPAHCANAVFAITGIILSLHRHSHPASSVQSSTLAKYLLQNFVRSETLTDVSASDEVQFAVLVSLSFITPLAAVDEKLVSSVLDVFYDRLQMNTTHTNTSSELSSWATFAIGWAFCNVLAGLVNSPTKTAELNKICLEQLQLLLHVYEASTGSFELILGILIAFPRLSVAIAASSSPTRKSGDTTASCSNEETEIVQKIKIMARCDLEVFLENQQQGFSAQLLARLLGAPWVIAFSDRAEASQDDIKSDTGLLDRTLLAATSRRDLQPQLVHFTVPFCHMIHTNLDVRNPASHEISLFTGRVHSLVNLIRITPTSAARHTAVVALASLFGVDWCRGPTVMSMGSNGLFSYFTSSNNPVAMTSVSNSALTTLMELSGLSISITTDVSKETTGVGTLSNAYAMAIPASKAPSAKSALMVQDLKAGRLAAMVLGHIACHFHRLGQADVGKVIGTSSEPKDYSRLPTSTSWLRALWDGMWEPLQMGTVQRSRKSYRTALEVMLYTVYNLPAPLPAVNWFPLLTQLVALEPRLIIPAIHMASRHANTSTSLMEFLIMQLSGFKIGDVVSSSKETKEPKEGREEEEGHGVEELYVGEEGLGRILALGGLPLVVFGGGDQVLVELDKVRGLGGIAKKVSLPSSRVIDVMEKLSNELFFAVGNCSDVNVTERASERQDPQKEVLQLLFLDTLSNHIRPYRQGQGCSAAAGKSSGGDGISAVGTAVAAASATQNKAINNQNTLTEDAKELLSELRAVILRVFYRVSFNNFLTAQRVLRRLADLSLTSLSHLDAAQLDTSLDATTGDRGSRVLKEAIGISSLYRAGYLTSQQEARLIRTAQSALLIVSDTSLGIQNRKFAESAISVLLYAMNSGVAERRPPSSLSMRRKKRNAQRFTWLQRILDLLVLFSNQYEAFSKGVTLLLGGAVLLWWDEKDIVSGFSLVDLRSEGLGGSSLQTLDNIDDTEVGLLANVDEHDLEHGDDASENNATAGMDHNSLEDDEFELWHQQFVQGISVDALTSEGAQEQYHHHQKMNEDGHQRNIMGRVSLILPDIIMNIRGRTASPTSSDGQTASRLLRMALDTQINPTERQFLIGLLRRIEDLVPIGQTWILK